MVTMVEAMSYPQYPTSSLSVTTESLILSWPTSVWNKDTSPVSLEAKCDYVTKICPIGFKWKWRVQLLGSVLIWEASPSLPP